MSGETKEPQKLIATNPNAKRNFFIEEMLEAGIMLQGTEIKSLREQSPNLKDSFVEISQKNMALEAWLVNAHIPHYKHGNVWNHEPSRRRKLLLNKKEIEQIHSAISKKGMTVVTVKMYFKRGKAKVQIGVGKGKKSHDKRDDLKKKSAQKEISQALKKRNR